jgi:hypothetical protein
MHLPIVLNCDASGICGDSAQCGVFHLILSLPLLSERVLTLPLQQATKLALRHHAFCSL